MARMNEQPGDPRAFKRATRRHSAVEDLRHAARRSDVARLVLADVGFFEETDLGTRLAAAVEGLEDVVEEVVRRHRIETERDNGKAA